MNQPAQAPYVCPDLDEAMLPENPYAPIVMVEHAGGFVAMLGPIELGQARPHEGGRHVHAYWQSQLPGGENSPRPAPTIKVAQDRLAARIRDWFAACGQPLPEVRR
jgi:hypothetical protein